MKLLITGADGFIGKNLVLALRPRSDITILPITRGSSDAELKRAASEADFVVHLAGINKQQNNDTYQDNATLTERLVAALGGKATPIIYSSSNQVERPNDYGRSKLAAEQAIQQSGAPHYIYRLPNVFGKFAKPEYNSAVATFCHRVARDLPLDIHAPTAKLTLVHIDDVVASFISAIDGTLEPGLIDFAPTYDMTVRQLAQQIEAFRNVRENLVSERVGEGLVRALYATYVSYLPQEKFQYPLTAHTDARGTFVEMLKTHDSGQFSYFTAHPGVTRGGHYHHTKTEKFLVIAGKARFTFRHMISGERHEIKVTGEKPEVVETIPGWTHEITNTGKTELVVMLWANENFDANRPDTYEEPV